MPASPGYAYNASEPQQVSSTTKVDSYAAEVERVIQLPVEEAPQTPAQIALKRDQPFSATAGRAHE